MEAVAGQLEVVRAARNAPALTAPRATPTRDHADDADRDRTRQAGDRERDQSPASQVRAERPPVKLVEGVLDPHGEEERSERGSEPVEWISTGATAAPSAT